MGRGLQRSRLPFVVELVMLLVRRGGVVLDAGLSSIKAESEDIVCIIRKKSMFHKNDTTNLFPHSISFHFISLPFSP